MFPHPKKLVLCICNIVLGVHYSDVHVARSLLVANPRSVLDIQHVPSLCVSAAGYTKLDACSIYAFMYNCSMCCTAAVMSGGNAYDYIHTLPTYGP